MDVFLAMKSHDYFFNSQIFPDTFALNTIDDYKMRKYYVIDKPYANFIVLREPFANTLKRYTFLCLKVPPNRRLGTPKQVSVKIFANALKRYTQKHSFFRL